jgi:hypothetical protein
LNCGKRTSGPLKRIMTLERFREQLYSTLERATLRLLEKIGDEKLYAIGLSTSGEGDFSYVFAAANTEKGLQARCRYYATHPKYSGKFDEKQIRWMSGDWLHRNFAPELEKLDFPAGEGEERDDAIYEVFIECLQRLQTLKALQRQCPQVVFVVTCADMSEESFMEGLRRLNPPEVYEKYVTDNTPANYLKELEFLPRDIRLEKIVALYRDLSLGVPSELAKAAEAQNVDRFTARALLGEFGDDGATRLLDLIEQYGFGPIFNKRGSAAFKRFGAFTAENTLSTSSVFALLDCDPISEKLILRMQEILRKRVQADRGLSITSTLAENIARVLHQLRPRRFPKSELDPKTNHLRNPEPFLPR